MEEAWIVFYGPNDEELAAVTVRGLGMGEIEATIALLANEQELDPAQIAHRVEMR